MRSSDRGPAQPGHTGTARPGRRSRAARADRRPHSSSKWSSTSPVPDSTRTALQPASRASGRAQPGPRPDTEFGERGATARHPEPTDRPGKASPGRPATRAIGKAIGGRWGPARPFRDPPPPDRSPIPQSPGPSQPNTATPSPCYAAKSPQTTGPTQPDSQAKSNRSRNLRQNEPHPPEHRPNPKPAEDRPFIRRFRSPLSVRQHRSCDTKCR